jgi:putative heme-binding domain-containing protein
MKHYFEITLLITSCFTSLCAIADAANEPDNSGLSALVQLLGQVDDAAIQLDLLTGMFDALEGRRDMKMPSAWPEAYPKLAKSPNESVREKSTQLALIFGDPKAIASLRSQMMDRKAPVESRRRALSLLTANQVAGLDKQLYELLDDVELRGDAIRGLAGFGNPKTPTVLLNAFDRFTPEQRADAIQTLATRPTYSTALLDAVKKGVVQPSEISAFAARQIDSLGDATIKERLKSLWGDVLKTSKQQQSAIAKYKKTLSDDVLAKANLAAGRVLFDKHCKNCHTLYGEGGKIGPDITGGNRNNLDYILENILAPSAAVPRAYQVNIVATEEGRVLNGIIVAQTPQTITLQTVNERIVLDRKLIAQLKPSPLSMMPDGLFEKMSQEEVRDLIAYLRERRQVAIGED